MAGNQQSLTQKRLSSHGLIPIQGWLGNQSVNLSLVKGGDAFNSPYACLRHMSKFQHQTPSVFNKILILKTRLDGAIYSSDANLYKSYSCGDLRSSQRSQGQGGALQRSTKLISTPTSLLWAKNKPIQMLRAELKPLRESMLQAN